MEQNPKKSALTMPASMVHAIWKDQQTIIKPQVPHFTKALESYASSNERDADGIINKKAPIGGLRQGRTKRPRHR